MPTAPSGIRPSYGSLSMVYPKIVTLLSMTLSLASTVAYAIEQSAIQAAVDRYKVVGVISEESPKKPLAGVAVLKDLRTSHTFTLAIGDPLPENPALCLVSTKAGHVVISDGRKEATLLQTETEMDEALSSVDQPEEGGSIGGKWEDNVSILGQSYSRLAENSLSKETDSTKSNVALGLSEEKGRFPYFKVDNAQSGLEKSDDAISEGPTEMDPWIQDWEWTPASEINTEEALKWPEPKWSQYDLLREGDDAIMNPWWLGEGEARSPAESEL
jgi:hypothetical protein